MPILYNNFFKYAIVSYNNLQICQKQYGFIHKLRYFIHFICSFTLLTERKTCVIITLQPHIDVSRGAFFIKEAETEYFEPYNLKRIIPA